MNVFHPPKPLYLTGPASFLPGEPLDNQTLIDQLHFDKTPAVISFTTGIKSRHWANDNQSCSSLSIEACHALFAKKPSIKAHIKQLILATISGDYPSPPTSPLIQHRLGLEGVGAFDLGAACAGFTTGLHVGASLTHANEAACLIIASEVRSKFLNKKDFGTSVLFGDGACACYLSSTPNEADFRFIASASFADGEISDAISIPAGGSLHPGIDCKDPLLHTITMKNSAGLFIKAVNGTVACAKEFMQHLGLSAQDIDYLVPHQGNKHLIHAVAKELNFQAAQVISTIDYTANTSGASVGIALTHLLERQPLKKGQRILLISTGGGGLGACALLQT